MTWSHSPTFSFTSFVAIYLGRACCANQGTSSNANNEQHQANCAAVFRRSSLLFSNTVSHFLSKTTWTTGISAIFSTICHRGRVSRMPLCLIWMVPTRSSVRNRRIWPATTQATQLASTSVRGVYFFYLDPICLPQAASRLRSSMHQCELSYITTST